MDLPAAGATARLITPHWNPSLIAGAIGISFLGAFTSTQLMCQARSTRYLSAVIVWLSLSSLIFGFCSIWSLHFVAMMAFEMDLTIGLNPILTALSAFLAVFFTFCALASDTLLTRYRQVRLKSTMPRRKSLPHMSQSMKAALRPQIVEQSLPLARSPSDDLVQPRPATHRLSSYRRRNGHNLSTDDLGSPSESCDQPTRYFSSALAAASNVDPMLMPLLQDERPLDQHHSPPSVTGIEHDDHTQDDDDEIELTRRTTAMTDSGSSMFGFDRFASIRLPAETVTRTRNVLLGTIHTLWDGLTLANIVKGLCWSLAITSMHYVGILALRIPNGYCHFSPTFVLLSALISWLVCVIGTVLMASMETNITQQLLFSLIATLGVAAMHFTGMRAVSFWSTAPPADVRGYSAAVPITVSSIGIITCFAANGLVAHSATVARNKLVEIVTTRKKLYKTIAQKKSAEAVAMARSEFIASASHEIRTPLHQLQGFSDLLSQTRLNDESRVLLENMQDAIRSLSLITNNVLDWSRLEKGEATCRPTALDIRKTMTSIMNLLPIAEEEGSQMELLIVISPDVPDMLALDESYFNRIIMNLVSNSLKHTTTGHVLVAISVNAEISVLRAAISDTGSGIPTSFLPNLFEPYKQAETRARRGGIGLGLSIIKQLLQNMKGTIELESRDQNDVGPQQSGSAFTVSIPTQSASQVSTSSELPQMIHLLGDYDERTVRGIAAAWAIYGVDVNRIDAESAGSLNKDSVVWTDAAYLLKSTMLLDQLASTGCRIIAPYGDRNVVRALSRHPNAQCIMPARRPLMLHRIINQLSTSQSLVCLADATSSSVRLASVISVLDDAENVSPVSPTTPLQGQPETLLESAEMARSKRPTALIVEDNKINQRLGTKMMKSLGFNVILADDGQKAIDTLLTNDKDIECILMDHNMPNKDGLTATREIRELEVADKRLGRRLIIMVTAVSQAEKTCSDAGIDAFLAKPLSLAKLKETLDMFGLLQKT